MKLFVDHKGRIYYEVVDKIPNELKADKKAFMEKLLPLYMMYRNGIYTTRIHKELDPDIAVFKPRFEYEYKLSKLPTNNHLMHYASYIALDAMNEMFNLVDAKCVVAYKKTKSHIKVPVGFMVYFEKEIDHDKMVYLSHVSVAELHKGIGSKLIETVMVEYPPNTHFYLCARKRNAEGIPCYEKLGFKLDPAYIENYGYNDHFVGMSAYTTFADVEKCERALKLEAMSNESIYFKPRQF